MSRVTRPESRNMRQARRIAWMDERRNHLRDLELDGGGRSCNGTCVRVWDGFLRLRIKYSGVISRTRRWTNAFLKRRGISWSAKRLLVSEESLAEGSLQRVDCASQSASISERRQGGCLSVGLSERSQQQAPAVPLFMFPCFVQLWGSVVLCVIDLFTQVQRALAACSFRSEHRILLHKFK
jgi:hypothetical protein